jgi:hypothetical protein
MTSKSVSDGDVKNLADFGSDSDFESNDEADQWVCWEFRESFIRPTHYTIRSCDRRQLKSWKFEGSMNGEHWTELSHERNDSHLKEDFAAHSFEVKSPFECRFLRLSQTGKNHWNSHALAFCSLEIFGTLSHRRFPLQEAKPLDGIISYLTTKHRGNVHDEGIVTITSKSVVCDSPRWAVRNAADFTSDLFFQSRDRPGQWVCWDFHEMRVRPTHYTIKCYYLKSWMVESSLNGEAWTEIDRQTDNEDFTGVGLRTASFAVSKSDCRFIRLTQTDTNHCRNYSLQVGAFEVFGTLIE